MSRLDKQKLIQEIYQKALKLNYDMNYFNLASMEQKTYDQLIKKYVYSFGADLTKEQQNIKNICDSWLHDFNIIMYNRVIESCTSIIIFDKLDFSLAINENDLESIKYFYTENNIKLISLVLNDNNQSYNILKEAYIYE